MMTGDLTFMRTWTIPQFKQNFGIETIEVKRNEKTGKLFFVYGIETGACSKQVEGGGVTRPVISQVVSTTTGEQFYMLHQQGEGGGATTIFTL
jgi:hypothetical protein